MTAEHEQWVNLRLDAIKEMNNQYKSSCQLCNAGHVTGRRLNIYLQHTQSRYTYVKS